MPAPRVGRAAFLLVDDIHAAHDADALSFDVKRQVAELQIVTSSRAGQTLVAENYAGLPIEM